MLKDEIKDRVEGDKERRERKEDMNKPNKRKATEDRRKVKCRRGVEDAMEDRRMLKDDSYD